MASLTKISFIRIFSVFLILLSLSGCSEFRTMFSVLFTGASSLSTSAFEFDEIRSGSHVSCAILGDKTVRCVGSGELGNLGTYGSGFSDVPGEVKQVSAGKEFTCMLIGDKMQVFCMGKNNRGQLGNPALGNSANPIPVLDAESGNKPITDVKSITTGEAHACVLLKSGRAICWGDNTFGQTGVPETTTLLPHSVLESERNPKPLAGIHSVSAGGNSTCILAREDFSVLCFGERFGGNRKVNWSPERIEIANGIGTLSAIKQIGVGRKFGCALARNSQVYCWGSNEFNQLGALSGQLGIEKASEVKVTYPEEMRLSHIEEIAVGDRHACAINRDEKTVYCWGDNRVGELGNTSVRGNPEQVALGANNLTLKGVKSLAVGSDRTCIVSLRDEVFCWGNGAHGILGNSRVSSQYPIRALDAAGENIGNAQSISIGYDHTCVIVEATHKLYCFGVNSAGQLGIHAFSGTAILADTKPITNVSSIDTYGNKTCMIYGEKQSVGCFGGREIDNLNKQPEKNSFITENFKRGNQLVENAVGVAVGKNHLCVIEGNQSVNCTQFAEITSAQTSAVVNDSELKPLKDIWQIRSREEFNCGLTQENGGIWCWGKWKDQNWANAVQLKSQGKNSSEYIQIAMSNDQICGVRGVERQVYCTKYGESAADKFTLEPMLTAEGRPLANVLTLSGGDHHLCAANEDGKLICWGENDSGQLGIRSRSVYQNPTLVVFKLPALKKITRVTTGNHFTCVAGAETPALFCFGDSLLSAASSSEPVEYPL